MLRSKSAEDVCAALLECWCTLFTGYPRVMRVDQESAFSLDKFHTLVEDCAIILQFSGVESHNSLGFIERYHRPLRSVFSVVRRAHHNIHPEVALWMSFKGMNETLGPEGLASRLLVFGSLTTPPFKTPTLRS